jgi:transposase
MEVAVDKVWVGIDAGKEFHWVHVLDASGRELLSRKLENDETEISELVGKVVPLAKEVVWAVDQPGGSAALLLALLWERGQGVLYVPGLTVNRASDAYRGESKTDARDARVIADLARMRSDLGELEPGEEEIAELRILLGRRRDLVIDQNRIHNPPRRGALVGVSGSGAGVGSEQERPPYPSDPLPEPTATQEGGT